MQNLYNVLLVLSSITGVQSDEQYSASNNIIYDKLDDIYEIDSSDIIIGDYVYNIYGSNQYIQVEVDDDWLLMDLSNYGIEECLNYDPYSNSDNIKIYNEFNTIDKHYIYTDNFYSMETNSVLTKENVYMDTLDSQKGEYYPISSYGYSNDSVLIDDYFYFQNLNHFHSYNESGTCSVVAAQIILGYYDTFYNDNIVSSQYDLIVSESKKGIASFTQSPGTGLDGNYSINYQKNQLFHDYLYQVAIQAGKNTSYIGLTSQEQFAMMALYFDLMNINCTFNYQHDGSEYTKQTIMNAINQNRPVYCGGSGHTVVAYGYDEDYVYVHTGWGYVAKTPWSTFDGSVVDMTITSSHVHSNNYYSTYYNEYLCGCTHKEIHESGNITLQNSSYSEYYTIKYTATSHQYFSIRTITDEYDTSFYDIVSSVTYEYYDDTEGISDEEYDYNAYLVAWEMDPGDTIELRIDISYISSNIDLSVSIIDLE